MSTFSKCPYIDISILDNPCTKLTRKSTSTNQSSIFINVRIRKLMFMNTPLQPYRWVNQKTKTRYCTKMRVCFVLVTFSSCLFLDNAIGNLHSYIISGASEQNKHTRPREITAHYFALTISPIQNINVRISKLKNCLL
jgi:hypothetical protein